MAIKHLLQITGAYTHGFAYICGCLSLSFFFDSDVDVFHEDGSILV